MKKIYTLLLGASLPLLALADGKTLPYESQFYQDAEWVVHNVNEDTETWTDYSSTSDFSGSGYTVGKKYKYHSSNAANDWLVGPAIHLEAGVDYKVKFYRKVSSSSYEEKLKLFIGTENTPASLLENGIELIRVEDKNNTGCYHVVPFTVDTTGDYYFGFQCYSDANKFNQYITGFQVREDVFAPGAPTELKVVPGADRAMTATLTWKLPVKDLDGVALPDGATYEEIRILRDGVQLNTPDLAGDATEFVDSEAFGLTSGVHTYQVISVVNGTPSPAATVTSKYIGPIAPMSIPFSALTDTWGSEDDFELFWSTDKGRDSDTYKSWEYFTPSYGDTTPYLRYYSSNALDEWLISPVLAIAEPGVYRISYDNRFDGNNVTLSMYTGSGTTLGGYTDKIAENTGKQVQGNPVYGFFSADAAGTKQIAFHIECPSTNWTTYYVYDIKIEKWHVAPVQIADLAVAVTSDGNSVNLTWTNPSLTNTGDALTSISKFIVYCDGQAVATVTDNLTPGASSSYTHENPTSGVHTYYVEVYTGEIIADGTPMSVTSKWVGDESQAVPYNTYFAVADATRPIWSAFDANNDGLTFVMPQEGVAGVPTLKKVTDYVQHDDYLLSPYFTIDKPGYYNALWVVAGGASGYLLETGYVTDKNDVAGTFTKVGENCSMTGSYGQMNFPQLFYFETPGRYALALHTVNQHNPATSDDKYIEVKQLGLTYQPVNPNAPENFTASAAPANELKAVLKWTNPTESNFEGVTPVIAKAVISRKQGYGLFEQIAEITEGLVAGEEFTWIDETLTAPGIYKYQVVLHGPEGQNSSAYAQALTGWVGPGMTLPVSINIDTNTDPDLNSTDWTIYNVNGDTNPYVGDITWEASGASVGISSNNAADTDDWAIHGFYQFDKGDEYKFTVRNSTTNDTTTDWELWLGDSDHYDGMYVKVADITTPTEKYAGENHSFILKVTDAEDTPEAQAEGDEELPVVNVRPGATSIGLHLAKPGQVSFRGFAFEVIKRAVKSIELSATEAELTIGGTMTLTATVLPEDATDKTVTWTSSDEAIATVDAEGNVTAVAPGQVEITATSNGISSVCPLTVKPVVAESVTLSATEAELIVGNTMQLTATVAPENVTDKTITWSTSDEAVATVAADGTVTAVAPGQAVITAACGEASATCALTVKPVLAESVTISETEAELTEGETLQLTATVAPDNTTDKTVTWTSSDETVATVDAEGLVTAVAPGQTVITAACGEAKGTCTLTVVARVIEVTGITLDQTSIFGAPGNSQKLTATVTPDDATDKTVTWSSSDEAVATVDADGLVTFVADGHAVITAACGEFTATCNVEVLTNGIALIPADMRDDARVYTLQGIEVKPENLTPGFYIVTFLRDGQRMTSKIRL